MPDELKPALKIRNMWRDLVIVIVVTSLGTVALLQVNAFELLGQLISRHEARGLDAVILGIVVLAVSLIWFVWRRWREYLHWSRANLQDSENRLRDAIESMSEGFALYDADERLVFCNEPYRMSLPRIASLGLLRPGISIEEIIRAGIEQGFTPPLYASPEDYLTKRLRAFRQPAGPIEYETTAGQWIRFEERKISNGGTVGIRADITERKRAQQALQENEELLRSIVDYSPSAIFLNDLKGKFLLANKRFGAWFKRSPAEIVGRSVRDILPEDYEKPAIIRDADILDKNEVQEWEAEIPLDEAESRLVHFSKFPVSAANGGTIGVGVIGTDITDRTAMEEQLRQAQKMEAVGLLTGGVAHDFNNLLGVIVGNLDFLDEDLAGNTEQQEMVASALQAALQGAELTSRLLAFSRKQALHPQVVSINDLINGMTDLLKRTLGETVSCHVNAATNLKPTEIDSGQFETALINLAVNARHAMPDGGHLTIETANVELDPEFTERLVDVAPGTYAMLAISDTGTGMSEDVLERAYDPFFTTKKVGEGSGLGLSMVYGFVKQSNGHISIDSEEGEGTTVKLYFPSSATRHEPEVRPDRDDHAPLGGGESVLIVEDDEFLRQLAVKLISSLGYRVSAAPDGPSALAMLDNGSPVDVLFTDVVLPNGVNGVALAAAAKQRRPGLRVLFTSGYTQNAIEPTGADDHDIELLDKPYRRRDVAERLRLILDR